MYPSDERRLRCVRRWLHAPTRDEAVDAIIDLALVFREERHAAGYVPRPDGCPLDGESGAWDEQAGRRSP